MKDRGRNLINDFFFTNELPVALRDVTFLKNERENSFFFFLPSCGFVPSSRGVWGGKRHFQKTAHGVSRHCHPWRKNLCPPRCMTRTRIENSKSLFRWNNPFTTWSPGILLMTTTHFRRAKYQRIQKKEYFVFLVFLVCDIVSGTESPSQLSKGSKRVLCTPLL